MVESSYSILDGDQCCVNVGYVWTIRVIHLPKVKRVVEDNPSRGANSAQSEKRVYLPLQEIAFAIEDTIHILDFDLNRCESDV